MLILSESLKNKYPGGLIGAVHFKNASNNEPSPSLQKLKEDLQTTLRDRYRNHSRLDLGQTEPIKTYVDYYKHFRKTYHVLLQLESIVFKNKSIPNVSPLVTAMFMAELKNQYLTAGHDLDTINLPIRVDISQGCERYTLLNGQDKELIQGDMMMIDGNAIISSIVYGPDNPTQIKENTTNVIYVVYAPPGIKEDLLEHHLEDINQYVKAASPDAALELQQIFRI